MTVQLNVEARVDVNNAGALPALNETAGATKSVGAAMQKAAADAKAAGTSISQSVRAVASEVQELARQQVSAAQQAAFGRRGAERAAALERTEEIRRSTRVEIEEAKRAADAVIAEARRKNAAEQSAAQAAMKARSQYRTGMAQVGMQMNDVATQAASGTAPMIIFAQQANQVGYAMSMMGGAAGRVGGILAGPWGAAITVAVMALGMLSKAISDGGDAGDWLADRYGEAGVRIRDEFVEPAKAAVSAVRKLIGDGLGFLAENTMIQLDMAAKKLAWFKDLANRTAGAGSRAIDKLLLSGTEAGDNISIFNPSELGAQKERQRREAEQARKGVQTRAALGGVNAALGWGDLSDEKAWRDLLRRYDEGQRKSKQASDSAVREAKRAADAAIREAQRVAEAQAKFVEKMVDVAREAASFNLFRGGIVEDQYEARERRNANDSLSKIVDTVDSKRDEEKAARDAADAAVDQLFARADEIGQRIGGAAGGALRTAAGVIQGVRKGDFSGVGGAAGTVLQYSRDTVGQTRWFRESIADPITKKMTEIFGTRDFAKILGETLQTVGFGASMGALVGGNTTGSKVGGAIGSVVGKELGAVAGKAIGGALGGAMGPIGSIVGSLAGSLIGGMFNKAKTGTATAHIANGVGAVTGQGGNNDSQMRATTKSANAVISSMADMASALGGDLGNARVSISAKNDKYYVDYSGGGRTKKGGGVVETKSADEAMALAMADAIHDGAITNVSAAVQSALRKYADDLNRAVAEAIKIQNLEKVIANDKNPFASLFLDFEKQMKERVRVAKDYGFNLVEIERINAEERAEMLKSTMTSAASTIKSLLDDLKYGSRAEGSATERLTAMEVEKQRIQGLINGGANDQNDALAAIVQQMIDLSKEAYGTTGRYANDRMSGVTTLEAVLAQTEARIKAAADAAYGGQSAQLTELNTTADEQLAALNEMKGFLASLVAGMSSGGGGVDATLYTRLYVDLK